MGRDMVAGERHALLVFAREQAAGERHAANDAKIIFARVREEKLFRPTVKPVVKNLQRLRAELRRLARLQFAAFLQNGNAEMVDFTGAFLFREKGPQLFRSEEHTSE